MIFMVERNYNDVIKNKGNRRILTMVGLTKNN